MTEYGLITVLLAQLGIIYGLTRVIIRQAGQHPMRPSELFRQMEAQALNAVKKERDETPRGKKVGSIGVDPQPDYLPMTK